MGDLLKIAPPTELTEPQRSAVFEHFFRRLASHRNNVELFAAAETRLSSEDHKQRMEHAVLQDIDHWAQELLQNAWVACQEPGGGSCPKIDPLSDTSVAKLPALPDKVHLEKLLNTTLFLHITTSKSYSSHTRVFLFTFAPVDESAIVSTLKHPDKAVEDAQKMTERVKQQEADKGKTFRMVGMGLAGLAGGALIGITGGLAAPLVGAGVSSILGFIGVGGTAAGLLASGIASSSVVCGTLFGVYGARSSASIVEAHIREVRDLALVPVRPPKKTLAVRLCVSGWLSERSDITAPWTVLSGEDTYALQWEVEALEALGNALENLIKTQAMQYIKTQIIKRTVLAALFAALAPTAWLQITKVINNPWMNAKALAVKAGAVLGTLLADRVFGTRPVTLVGYSLGALVILEALKHLAALPPAKSAHLVQDVYLFGTPAPADARVWAAVRRVVAGRLVNGYCEQDYILAVLSRASDASWGVAGLQPVDVMGVQNVNCEDVDGHLKWRGKIGKCLQECGAPGIEGDQVEMQMRDVAAKIDERMELDEKETAKVLEASDVLKA